MEGEFVCERAIDRREETICIGPSPLIIAAVSAVSLAGCARESLRERRAEEGGALGCDSGMPDGRGGEGEQCARSVDEQRVSTDHCGVRASQGSAQCPHQGKICIGHAGENTRDDDGGSGRDTGKESGTATCQKRLNNSGGRVAGEKPISEDNARASDEANLSADQVPAGDRDGVIDTHSGTVESSASQAKRENLLDSAITESDPNLSGSTDGQDCSSLNGVCDTQKINAALETGVTTAANNGCPSDSKETDSATYLNGEDGSSPCHNGDSDGGRAQVMGNQTSSARVGSAGGGFRPKKLLHKDRNVESPSSRVDAAVHFKKESSESAGSDGGSISILSERKQLCSGGSEETHPSAATGVFRQVAETASTQEKSGVLNDLNKKPSVTQNSHQALGQPTQLNSRRLTAHSNIPVLAADDFEQKDMKARDYYQDDYSSLSSSYSTIKSSQNDLSTDDGRNSSQTSHNVPGEATPTAATANNHHSYSAAASTISNPLSGTTPATVTQLGDTARSVKLGPKTEDIYALPVPRRMRSPAKANLVRQKDVQEEEDEEDVKATGPPPVPERLVEGVESSTIEKSITSSLATPHSSSSSKASRVTHDVFESQPNVQLVNTVQVTCQMKKSHTTCGSLNRAASSRDAFAEPYGHRGLYYGSFATGPCYDYFSLGRKPKRLPRVKTLTDSQGMAMSLDKLLKLRRQSPSPASSSSRTQLSQEPSVEDIIRSCSEYDMSVPQEPVYRDRTSSDADATRSPLDRTPNPRGPLLSFTEASQIKIPDGWGGYGGASNRRPANAKALIRAARNNKKLRASAKEARSKPAAGIYKSDSVRSAPPAPEDMRSAEDSIQAYTEIDPARSHQVKGGSEGSETKTDLIETYASDQKFGLPPSSSSSSTDTHSTSRPHSRAEKKAEAEVVTLKPTEQPEDYIRLREGAGKGYRREASFTSSSSRSSATSTVTVVAPDQLSFCSEPHSTTPCAATSSCAHTDSQPDTDPAAVRPTQGLIPSSSSNEGATPRTDPPTVSVTTISAGTATAAGQIVTVGKLRPADPNSGGGSEAKNGRNLSSSSEPAIIASSSGRSEVPSQRQKSSSDEKSSSGRPTSSSLAHGQKSLSTDSQTSHTSASSASAASKKRKMETESSKHTNKQKETKGSDKKSYSLKWLKPSDKSTKNKASVKASHEEPQIHLSITSEPDSRGSSLTTSGSLTSDPRSPLTSLGSLEDARNPVFSPLSPGAETSSLTVDTSTSSRDSGRISPFFAVPKSPNHTSKLEAYEALKWLRAAGFPQYAQMFEDGQFPLELSVVEKDHDFLDIDSLQSLFRRLETLNKYAGMKLENHPRKKTTSEEEDEEDLCALSERWEYQKSVRRWSRKDLQAPGSPNSPTSPTSLTSPNSPCAGSGKGGEGDAGFTHPGKGKSQRAPSHDSLLADQDDSAHTDGSEKPDPVEHGQGEGQVSHGDGHVHNQQAEQEDEESQSERHTSSSSSASSTLSPRLRRAASERIKTAKSLWRKMEGGLKVRKSRRHHGGSRGGGGGALEISDPVLADKTGDMKARLERLQCVDIKQGETKPDSLSSRLNPASTVDTLSSKSSVAGPKPVPQTSSSSTPTSTYSDSSSPGTSVPEPAFRSRPEESGSSSTTQPHTRPSSDSQPAAAGSSGARLSEYYSAQSQFQQTVRQAQQKSSSSDGLGNLMEIFLLPQDHQPGRFPTALQNGYIEKDPILSPTSAAVGEGSRENSGGNLITFPAGSQGGIEPQSSGAARARGAGANRTSVYDNFGLPNSKPSDSRVLNSKFSPIEENRKEWSPVTRSNRAMSADNAADCAAQTFPTTKDRSVSFDASSDRAPNSRDSSAISRNRSVSFGSSSGQIDQQKDDSAFATEDDSQSSSSRTEAYVDSLPTKGVSHSVSADSYFREQQGSATSASDTGSVSSATSQDDGSSISSSNTLHYSNYEEFEAILKQLYENISDLTSVMNWDNDETAPIGSTDTKPSTSTPPTTELHVDTPSLSLTSSGRRSRPQPGPDHNIDLDLEDLDSPLSPTSDPLALSPTASRGEGATDESLDLDQENSSSSSAGDAGSHTADSASDDAEALLADLSHDDSLDTIPAVTRERRDSGVGHSLTRAPSDRRRKKIRWHSFQRSHRPDINDRAQQVNALTVGQLVRLQKLALLKLTGIMEKCLPVNKSGWNWMMPRFMKRHKAPDFSDRTVFGVPLSVMVQRTGQPLPQCVLYAMRYLRRTSQSSIGIFRKSGVKSKIQQLRDHLEAHPDTTDFEGLNTYNVADMLKTFFRDLPECLLTSKMSETFRSIYTHVPQSQRLEAMQAAILLLPDENREVLQSILLFLSDISSHQADHQMNASNLAVCFTPTVFQLGRSGSGSPASPKRGRKLGGGNSNLPGTPDPREIMEQKAAHECLNMLITECKRLFTVPAHLFRQLQVISLAHEEPGPLHDLGTSTEEVRAFGQERIQLVLKEAHDRKSHWHMMQGVGDVEVYNRKPLDDYPLKEWKLMVDIEAPPIEVLRRIMHERHAWDEDLLSWSVVERLDPHSDIFQYALNTMAPHPSRHYCVLRYWRSDLTKGSCALVTMSVEHADVGSIQGVWAIDLGSYFLMEPCGAGRSRLTYITRVDTRGRTPEWYSKMYGFIQANFLERLKESFKQDTSGPETKV